jgi:PAS domain-containing protein
MSDQITEPERLADLRRRAASRLTGAAAGKGPVARATDALAVLHALASSPETAADALTLLHELQVHQVELDLQAQELQESRAELESALRRQIALYDAQPVGCFSIDGRLVLHEMNQTGADLLGVGRDLADGLGLDAFLDADSARRFRAAVSSVEATGVARTAVPLTLHPRHGTGRQVLASIGPDPAASGYLVSLALAGEPLSPPAQAR